MVQISDKIRDFWRNTQDQIIADAGHIATIYYPVTVSGVGGQSVDNLFGESLDPNDPNNISDDLETQTGHKTITGIFREDLYGTSVGASEAIQYTPGGRFEPEDCMFTCKISDALKNANSAQFYTYFHGCSYISISGLPDRFEVRRVGRRGLKDPHVLDVVMRRTND